MERRKATAENIEMLGRNHYRVRARVMRAGRRIERTKEVMGSLTEARHLRARLIEEINAELDAGGKPERQTLGVFSELWLTRRSARVRASSLERYGEALNHHILPEMGGLFIDAVTPGHVEDWLKRQRDATREVKGETRPKYSPATINGWYRVLRGVLRSAGLRLELPPLLREPRTREALTAEQLRKLLEVAAAEYERNRREAQKGWGTRDPAQYPLLLVLVTMGVRWGEATALQWRDIDTEAGIMRIERAHRQGALGPPKNGEPRVLPMPAEVVAVLKEWRSFQMAEQYPGFADGWVFATANDAGEVRLRFPSSSAKALRSWGRKAGIGRKVTPHLFRHSWVTLATEAGLDPIVRMALVGHAGLGVHRTYTTVRPALAREGQDKVVQLVTGGGS